MMKGINHERGVRRTEEDGQKVRLLYKKNCRKYQRKRRREEERKGGRGGRSAKERTDRTGDGREEGERLCVSHTPPLKFEEFSALSL